MLQPAGIADTVVLGLATWAVAVALHGADLAAPIRRVGVWASTLPKWLRWVFLPFEAAATCQFCVSWWIAAAIAPWAVPWTPWGLPTALILIPALVGVAELAEAAYTAGTGPRKPRKTADVLFAELAREQQKSQQFTATLTAEAARFKAQQPPISPA